MTYAREHRRAVRRIKAKKVRPDELLNWQKKLLEDDRKGAGTGEKK